MFHLDKQYYKSRIISDIELYHPSLFTDLSQNLIYDLNGNIFDQLSNLKELNLKTNKIEERSK